MMGTRGVLRAQQQKDAQRKSKLWALKAQSLASQSGHNKIMAECEGLKNEGLARMRDL